MIEEHKIIEKFRSARNYLDVIYDKSNWWDNCDKLEKAITELERLQQKETPMKVIVYDDEHAFECSNCLKHGVTDSMWLFTEIGEYDYCPRCGQRLDWNDSE
jgi:hypothetical protein